MNNVYTCGIRLPVTVKFLRLFIAFSIYLSFVFVAQQTQCFAVACSVERQQPLLRIVRTKCRCSQDAQANLTAQMSERISETKRRHLFVTSSHVPIRSNPPDAQSCSVFSVSGLRIKRGRAFSPDITLKPTV